MNGSRVILEEHQWELLRGALVESHNVDCAYVQNEHDRPPCDCGYQKMIKLALAIKPLASEEELRPFQHPESSYSSVSPVKSAEKVSNCCQAPMIVDESDEGTCFYWCKKCKKACDQFCPKPEKCVHDRPDQNAWVAIDRTYSKSFHVECPFCKPEARKDEKLIKNKIANALHYYRNCKDGEAEIEKMVDGLFELFRAERERR